MAAAARKVRLLVAKRFLKATSGVKIWTGILNLLLPKYGNRGGTVVKVLC